MSVAARYDAQVLSEDTEAVVHYTRRTGARPVNYTFEPPPGVPRNSGEVDKRKVAIRDARHSKEFSLDGSGFELVDHCGTLIDWTSFQDVEQVRAIDYPEIEALLRAVTGADKVLIFDHTLRHSSASPGRTSLREPVMRVHNDQTFDSAPRRVHKHLPADEASRRLQRRFAIINCWRPVGGPVLKAPLAMCDARSIEPGDLIASDLVYPDWTGETYAFSYAPRHRWFWFPRQTVREAALLKIFDSATNGCARLTAHTAFEHPTSAPDAPDRKSIEIRALVFW
ncbi:MAG TPA: CmcJ/NvfI family oxidoreductase [Steroidobacteraceae bacterium]|nr:CmcJ/NvfI family oxidoreductase [Steroidobacteraceae bacterium]